MYTTTKTKHTSFKNGNKFNSNGSNEIKKKKKRENCSFSYYID